MDLSVSPKNEIWFLRVCHHSSTGLYYYWAENSFLPEGEEEESKENQMLVVNSGKYGC